jgi:peptidoglycan biosynthesis protein MviN/MurJ (putative lipid II flippase)
MAYWLVKEGANTYVYLANRLLLFPHALTAMAVAVAVFPRLADEATEADRSALRRTLDTASSATLLVTLPAALGLIVLCDDVVAVLFQAQKFTPEDALQTCRTCMCLVAGLPFLGLAQLYARAFYAVGDNRAPARLAAWLVLVNFVLNLVLLLGFGLGTPGLAAASSVSSLLNAVVLQWLFRRHSPSGRSLRGAWLRSGVATALMCGAIWLVHPGRAPAGKWDQALWFVAVPILVGIGAYFAVHLLMRSPELGALRRRRGAPGAPGTA